MTPNVNQPIQSTRARHDQASEGATQSKARHNSLTERIEQKLAVYVHIPFCDYHCSFCDFAIVVGQKTRVPAYIDAVIAELSLRLEGRPKPIVDSVFFGGGTPGSIEPDYIAAVLAALRRSCDLAPDAEITLEANPGNHHPSFWPVLRQAGINRVSIGIQTLDDRILSQVGRHHSADDALAALCAVQEAGFASLSADLMFGLPGQTPAGWKDTLDRVLAADVDHISAYGLIIEPGTPMERGIRNGLIHPPSEDDAADMYEYALDTLAAAGFEHYEISNWGKPGLRSRHNLTYWRHDPYIGLGMGAHSYLDGVRSANLRGLNRYVQSLARGELPVAHSDPINPERARADAAMLGLRLVSGIDLPTFNQRFGGDLVADHADAVERFRGLKLLEVVNEHLRLTRRGYLVANQIWQEFI
jgi:oxygen-independent coproporphyrinogen III oxidase